MDHLATHGLSCRKSQGRHSRHAAINDLIKRSLATVKIPAHLEPTGISQSDGKWPDGATIVPWKGGRVLVWDTTRPDTFAPSHITLATREAGAVADEAEWRKKQKYSSLMTSHQFIPIAIETSGDPRSFQYKELLWQSSEGTLRQYLVPSQFDCLYKATIIIVLCNSYSTGARDLWQ